MEIGIDSFAALLPDPATGRVPSAAERLSELVGEIKAADRAGLDMFGVGEHHRDEFVDSSPAMILAAGAARTRNIRLTSAVAVLGAADPVRLFQDFATLDVLSNGRAELVVGRGSFGEAFSLYGLRRDDYDALFAEKLDLLLKLRTETHITWSGRFRPALNGEGVFPRPVQDKLPVWLGVGGTPASFIRAGRLGLPLMVAIIGGTFERFRPLIDLYREAGLRAGHAPRVLKVGIHVTGFVAETTEQAKEIYLPGLLHGFRKVAAERGWPPMTRAQFEASCGPEGSYLIGDPATVIAKSRAAAVALGGIDRLLFQMSAASGSPVMMLRAIDLLGTRVAPALRAAGGDFL